MKKNELKVEKRSLKIRHSKKARALGGKTKWTRYIELLVDV